LLGKGVVVELDELQRLAELKYIRWCIQVDPEGNRIAAGSPPDDVEQGALAAMALAIRETMHGLKKEKLADVWITTGHTVVGMLNLGESFLILEGDASQANLGMIRMQARRQQARPVEV
jgi:predicted regulator of Ras-like GTPase activity (Roadblock/LC7/MglB family)